MVHHYTLHTHTHTHYTHTHTHTHTHTPTTIKGERILCSHVNSGYANASRYIVARSLSICYLHTPLLHSSKLAAVRFGIGGGGVLKEVLCVDCRVTGDELCRG